jgi:hypothetical protein
LTAPFKESLENKIEELAIILMGQIFLLASGK